MDKALEALEALEYLKNEQNKMPWELENTQLSLSKFQISFKDKSSYITEEGWVAGTECWVCRLDVFNRVNTVVCRESFQECVTEAADRVKRYLNGEKFWWENINKSQKDKVFK